MSSNEDRPDICPKCNKLRKKNNRGRKHDAIIDMDTPDMINPPSLNNPGGMNSVYTCNCEDSKNE